MKQIDIMAFGSHPDDIEFGCGGILAKMASQKKSIVMVDLTLGEKGTNGSPELRRQEGLASAKLIGAERIFLDFPDCSVYDNEEGRLKIVKILRHYQPKLILAPTWKPLMTHPDHAASGLLCRAACRYARFSKILSDLPIYRPEGILHYMCNEIPDFIIDISPHFDIWKEMINCHKSQMKTNDYLDWSLRYASNWGLMIGKPYAQALIKGNPIEIDDIMCISKGTREI